MSIFRKLFKSNRIYLDYASLTPVDQRVVCFANEYLSEDFANPSSIYKEGINAKAVLKTNRKKLSSLINAQEGEVIFTSGGTESNNLAILGAIERLHNLGVEYSKMHVLLSVIEHSSIRELGNYLIEKEVEVEFIPINKNGLVEVETVKKMLKPNTVLVSVMTVNNEIGSIQPIREIAKIIRYFKNNKKENHFDFQNYNYPIFHSDASQAFLYEYINTETMGVDLLTLDSSKVYGPRGVGMLFIKKETPIDPIVFGGGQEFGLRSGTENISGIAGFVYALELAYKERDMQRKRILDLKQFFFDEIKKIRNDIVVNGGFDKNFSPHILNLTIPKIDNEFFVLQLDAKGVCISTKSSCLGDEDESYVLNALGVKSIESVRISFGRFTTISDIKKAIKIIAKVLAK